MQKIFKIMVVAYIALYSAWYFLPYAWLDLYDQQARDLLAWNGYGAKFDIYGPVSYAVGMAFLVSTLGLLFYKKWARIGYLSMTLLNAALVPFMGVAIQGSYDTTIGYILTLINGAIIAMMYLNSVGDKFSNGY